MAALVLAPGARFDGAAFYRHAQALPRYAAPVFVRLLAEQETTGTFKIRKVDLQREGFDPDAVRDPLFVRDDAARRLRAARRASSPRRSTAARARSRGDVARGALSPPQSAASARALRDRDVARLRGTRSSQARTAG